MLLTMNLSTLNTVTFGGFQRLLKIDSKCTIWYTRIGTPRNQQNIHDM